MILAVTDDLIFGERIAVVARAIGVEATVQRGEESLPGGTGGEQRISRCLVDLNGAGDEPLAVVRRLRAALSGVPIVGYCSHAQRELAEQALAAGCDEVLPRSQFVARLPELMRSP